MSVEKGRQQLPIESMDVDPAVENALGRPAKQMNNIYQRLARIKGMTEAQRRKAEKDRERSKATYDLPDWLIQAVEQIAASHGVPKSNVAAHLLAAGLRDLLDGRINLNWMRKISRSPRYEGLLESPDEIDRKEIERYCYER
ncbi:hypothetical protein [Thermanaerothrix sp.]|jgi:hypothetical protein|uniref:hypothetical protein n=1 Tax=Thermanaerothrix sp. TaxID=2972675 RepID=UPI002ADE739A|nr:hypothetical protein [Thermanaerothrix sp.]